MKRKNTDCNCMKLDGLTTSYVVGACMAPRNIGLSE